MAAEDAKYMAYVADDKGEKWVEKEWTGVPLGPNEVEVDIECSGVCESDHSMQYNLWGLSKYPMCAGHEGVGVITRVGAAVSQSRLQKRVGIGWIRHSCNHCGNCAGGEGNMCETGLPCPNITSVLGQEGQSGCFARKVRLESIWAFDIPEACKSETIAPFMCGGITVFDPIRVHCKAGMTVGVIGVGGLGHMAVAFLVKRGCRVIAFSHSDSKKELCMDKLGCYKFVNTSDDAQMQAVMQTCNVVINTPGVAIDFSRYIGTATPENPGVLRNGGKLVLVGAPEGSQQGTNTLNVLPLVFGGKQIIGSCVGGRQSMIEMLKFCGEHDVQAIVEVFDFKKINEAFQHLADGKARFRIVLKYDHE